MRDHSNHAAAIVPHDAAIYDGEICDCGSVWWIPAGVTVTEYGHVSRTRGPFTCADCGEPLPTPPGASQ